MNKSKHTTKSGPGRRHVEGTYRNGKANRNHRIESEKLCEKARQGTLTMRAPYSQATAERMAAKANLNAYVK